jgi:transposase
MRYERSDCEWTAIKPMLPNKPRGVRCVNDRRVLNGIFWVLRSGAPWRDLPENYVPLEKRAQNYGVSALHRRFAVTGEPFRH